jgi:hypothetical protein
MAESVLLGRGKQIASIPRSAWEGHLAQAPEHSRKRLAFMTEAHHQVRYFVVRELPRYGRPIPPSYIAQGLGLSGERVAQILDELERNLVFLVRNKRGEVAWAFPVTAEKTPHQIFFSSGEQISAA